jgi:hypothetical protein
VTIIPLALPLLAGSSDLPGGFGRAVLERLPIWSCSVRGFACHRLCSRRGALLPHLFTIACGAPEDTPRQLCIFCATVRQVTLPGRYPAHCPLEFGLSSPGKHCTAALAAMASPGGDRLAWLRPTRVARHGKCKMDDARCLPFDAGDTPHFALRALHFPPCVSRRFPARSGTAPASCTGCCAGCR